MAADPRTMEEALAALRRDPSRAVRAQFEDLTVELRAVEAGPMMPAKTVAEALDGVSWRGDETLEALLAFFAEARRQGGSGDVPEL
ncbi:MAG: hypothetical protein IT375_31030 [Polyangiaceae bacterium]|nr:hypothetical protein [Polyangiaceae bacterium]